ncbi:NUDIX hydrolase [Sphingosinicella sp. BN140058]|uniref:NUDIX hydrolase n=1 Tax=Sphingosinicella sp. BN140058 TaxID=1892855 RepID=UPI001FB18F1F|nr:NUDIX hydrolase [Sphingosinicella sp. BN140058]
MTGEDSLAVQYGVVPLRVEAGALRVLLITSRETRRWVVPRGNPIGGLSPAASAAQEAYEEAGVRGTIAPDPLGSYRYDKKRKNGSVVPTHVQLFEMRVIEELATWPEARERERRWFAPADAAEIVDEPDLKQLLRRLEGGFC